MNDDEPRERWAPLGLAALAVLAAAVAALARPAPERTAVAEPVALREADWVRAESPGPLWPAPRRDPSRARRAAEEARLDALVRRSQAAAERARASAAELEASLRALRPTLAADIDR